MIAKLEYLEWLRRAKYSAPSIRVTCRSCSGLVRHTFVHVWKLSAVTFSTVVCSETHYSCPAFTLAHQWASLHTIQHRARPSSKCQPSKTIWVDGISESTGGWILSGILTNDSFGKATICTITITSTGQKKKPISQVCSHRTKKWQSISKPPLGGPPKY